MIEELILQSVKEVLDTVLHHKVSSAVFKSIPLGNSTARIQVYEVHIKNRDFRLQVDVSICQDMSHCFLDTFVLCTIELRMKPWQWLNCWKRIPGVRLYFRKRDIFRIKIKFHLRMEQRVQLTVPLFCDFNAFLQAASAHSSRRQITVSSR